MMENFSLRGSRAAKNLEAFLGLAKFFDVVWGPVGCKAVHGILFESQLGPST